MNNYLQALILIFFCILFFCKISLAYDHVQEKQKIENDIFRNIRCMVCNSQSIEDSNSDLALDLKKFIRGKIDNGFSKDEIEELLITKFGDHIVFSTKIKADTIILWVCPILFILSSILIFAKILYQTP